MCGIAGIYSQNISLDAQNELTQKMLLTTKHRGPDFSKTWQHPNGLTLGHNRLSIIDLSEVSHQPLHYQDCTIVFNGEIYNYLEIKQELIQKGFTFFTNSDTEVIIAAYKAWGEQCVHKMMGMWAFVLYDHSQQKIWVSRDRFGIKPLYYIYYKDSFFFASEIKALKALSIFDNTLNIPHIYRYIQMGWLDYKEETFYTQISQLEAAHQITIQDKKINIRRYWDVNSFSQIDSNSEDNIAIFREKMIESVAMHMRSDVVVGGCLSGGIDSSTIASIVGTINPNVEFNTYTIYYDGPNDVDERPFANEVIKQYPNLKPYFLKPSEAEIAESFDTIQYHMDAPLPGSSPISQYFVMKLAKSHGAIVLLDGQGSDEYLAGYLHSFYRHIADGLMSKNPLEGIKRWNHFGQIQQFGFMEQLSRFTKSVATGIFGENDIYYKEYLYSSPFLAEYRKRVFDLATPNTNQLNQFLYNLLFTTSLPTLLHFEDRNSMAFSIESRVPFLDHRLVEFAFSLHNELKINKGVTKHILRESMRGIIPDTIANRMDKKGFVTPGEVKWLRGPLKYLIEEIDYSNLSMLDTQKVRQLIEAYKKGDNSNAKLVWRVATLSRWLKSS
jgi:asparagine synthase (glutamine-hydrolysing)